MNRVTMCWCGRRMGWNGHPYEACTEYVITECPDHGVKVTGDYATFAALIEPVAHCRADLDYERDTKDGVGSHAAWHEAEGHDCWVCCNAMVIDPRGYLDT